MTKNVIMNSESYNAIVKAITEVTNPFSNWVGWVSMIASLLTIIGFVITIRQLFSFKSELENAINEGKEKVNAVCHLVQTSQTIKDIELVQQFIQYKRYGMAAIKLQNVNEAIIEICKLNSGCDSLTKARQEIPFVILNLLDIDRDISVLEKDNTISYNQNKLQNLLDETIKLNAKLKQKATK